MIYYLQQRIPNTSVFAIDVIWVELALKNLSYGFADGSFFVMNEKSLPKPLTKHAIFDIIRY